MAGPELRTDVVAVYVFRHAGDSVHFLQLRRAADQVLPDTWQPVMGHVHAGETARDAALRELAEETGYTPADAIGLWQLEQPEVYFLHARQAIMLSPGFAVQLAADHEPALDADHDAARWVSLPEARTAFLWPGQRHAITQIERDLLDPASQVEPWLRLSLTDDLQ